MRHPFQPEVRELLLAHNWNLKLSTNWGVFNDTGTAHQWIPFGKKARQKGHSIWRQAKDQRPPSKEMAGDEKKRWPYYAVIVAVDCGLWGYNLSVGNGWRTSQDHDTLLHFFCWGERCYCTLNTNIRPTAVHFWPWGTKTYVFDGESTFFVYSKPPTYPWVGPTFFWPRPCIHLLSFFYFSFDGRTVGPGLTRDWQLPKNPRNQTETYMILAG